MIVCGILFITTSTVNAQTTDGPVRSLVSRIAQKFGLKESDVQAIFDEDRKERHTKMEALFESKLDEAVKSGKLTTAERQLILDKHQELEKKLTNKRELHKEFSAWANANSIKLDFLYRGGKHRGPPKWNH